LCFEGGYRQTMSEVTQTMSEVTQTMSEVTQTMSEVTQTMSEVTQTMSEVTQMHSDAKSECAQSVVMPSDLQVDSLEILLFRVSSGGK